MALILREFFYLSISKMAYIPGAGIKKPLNMLEGPVYPDIKKAPPRFQWSGKNWKVDTSVLRDTEQMTQFYEPAVLVQPRDYNKTRYGQSSHRDVVNAEFRPPLLDPIEDFVPLSRLPRKPVVPNINPSSAGHDGGTSTYTARNQRINGVESFLTDRVKGGLWRPTFYAPIEVPVDNSVLPDLEMKLPSVSVSAGMNTPVQIDAPLPRVTLDYERLHPSMDAGFETQIRLDGESGRENLHLNYTRPQVSVTAGVNTPVQLDAETRVDLDLRYNRPQVSASAGFNPHVQLNAADPRANLEFETRLDAPTIVLNPAPTDDMSTVTPIQESFTFLDDNRPAYSYQVPSQYDYRSRNELSHQPHFRQKLQVCGRVSTQGHIPVCGVMNPGIKLKNTRGNGAKKVTYKF